ncbi:MAG: dual specificity protein phosphatase family protein [Gammaproteobacteria bacterium]|nr:dual specificity protein phosphatase family protein [Gammaproteobacteria bacterium]
MDYVLDHLAIGDAGEGANPPEEVTALLCVAAELPPPAARAAAHQVPVIDMQPVPAAQLAEAIAWIAERIARERILVYCNAGVGRSPSICVGYLCCGLGYGFGRAVETVARRRPYMSVLPDLIKSIGAVCPAAVTE